MKKKAVFFAAVLVFILIACDRPTGSGESDKPDTGSAGDGRLDLIVEWILEDNNLPALAGVMVHAGTTVEMSAVGRRSVQSSCQVTVNDRWHIGSNTKSMTSLLAALLVKAGQIAWNSTIADIYPELEGTMKPEYRDVRLDEILSHTSGLPDDVSAIPGYNSYYTDTRPIQEQRRELVEKVLVLNSATMRGVYEYNNIGYIVAGAMLEEVSGKSWETLLYEHLFVPLGMTGAGFGAPDTQGSLAQPVGHAWQLGAWRPMDPSAGAIADNAPVLGPAGTVHTTLDGMAAYIALHLKGLRGESVPGFLEADEFEKLYTPFPDSDYALGWIVVDNAILHDGSNTMWYAVMVVIGDTNTALFAVTNAADLENGQNSKAIQAVNDLLEEMAARADAAYK